MEEQQRTDEVASERGEKRFLKYNFFRVVREWRFQGPEQKAKMKDEFLSVLDKHAERVGLQFFSLVGLRGDTDFMVLADSGDLEEFQRMVSELTATSLGRFLEISYSYLAMTRRSHYLGSHRHAGQEGMPQNAHTQSRYLFVYPFVKKREWYRLPFVERQRIMADHFRIGHKYPKIKINTGYSFGLDDQEFVLAFEGDDPSEFLALVEDLRGSEASAYTQLETPIFTCARVQPARMLDLLG